MGSTQAVGSLPAAGTCLAHKTSCSGFESTETQVPRKGRAAATLCDAVLAQADTGEVSVAPRSWLSLPSPSRDHLQRSRNKGSCQHFPLLISESQKDKSFLLLAFISFDSRKGNWCCPRGREAKAPRSASARSEPLGGQHQESVLAGTQCASYTDT